MIFTGIDNGITGAIVAIDQDLTVVLQEVMPVIKLTASKKTMDRVALLAIIQRLMDLGWTYGVLEKAQSMPKQGASSMFSYGRAYGAMEMALLALQAPHELRHPRSWQKAVLKGIEGSDTKGRAILKVQRAIPTLDLTPGLIRKPHIGLADAACMALDARLLHLGMTQD